ncbi:MAG: hypothetical protein GXY44_05615 [Phycisphaerales bacterium]|nr:hypothetical protein [Phycisphaerales bacterium]
MRNTLTTSYLISAAILLNSASAATTLNHYYAHDAVEDEHGVIAPWYTGQNGQCDARIRVAAETLKRYPWTDPHKTPRSLPEYIYSGHWRISEDGTISIPRISDLHNGDYGQRAAYTIGALIEYYRYTGDAAALAHVTLYANALLDFALTPEDHPWPRFPISVPVRGIPYGQADPRGFMQLDIVGEIGVWMVRAAQIIGNEQWMNAATHWADLLAERRLSEPGLCPWPRYANPWHVPWEDRATGGVVYLLEFFDELIRSGYTGRDDALLQAREAGMAYLRDVLLPDWTGYDTWGRNYWDWGSSTQVQNVTTFTARYLMNYPEEFPNWPCDARNILTLFLNRAGVNSASNADTFSGAWAYPESRTCCDRSLVYAPQEVATAFAQYGAQADSEWAREMARRKIILNTYDFHENGVVEDLIDGGAYIHKTWFKIAHPWVLKNILHAMAWMPELFGAARENHIMRNTSVVTNVVYDEGLIRFDTHDAPAGTVTVLRLAYTPQEILAGNKPLKVNNEGNGYQVLDLPSGDKIVTVRHEGHTSITIRGDDPQESITEPALSFCKEWIVETVQGVSCRVAAAPDATLTVPFTGNQIRLLGGFAPDGGLADIYLDGQKQLVGIDCWNPTPRFDQVLYYRNGLSNGPHELKIVTRGAGNPYSQGSRIFVQKALSSAATGTQDFGSGGGPTDAQRMIFGYTKRTDYVDTQGHAWRPGTEFIIRLNSRGDSVAASWRTQPRQMLIAGTEDPELYRYGVRGKDFWVDVTVGPGTYHARLKFMESRVIDPKLRCVSVSVNGREMITNMDVAATAAQEMDSALLGDDQPSWQQKWPLIHGMRRAVDVVLNDLEPVNGIISIRFQNTLGGQAEIQAIEVGPGDGGRGVVPVSVPAESQPESGSK